ncbi:MAG TPA: hypothetical protein VFH88_06995 [Candidatus Krumholzibacteria bacterium]|nr:hypothetical protein [Candidatus Krumholzibacteria bacterium]
MIRIIVAILCLTPGVLSAQPPKGAAREAIDDSAFVWIKRDAPHLRLYFPTGSYAAAHQEELVQRCETARTDILKVLGVKHFDDTVDVFFVENRDQMKLLTGYPVTGFAAREDRAAFLMTNPDWRAFERHEMMHVYAHNTWGPASGAWVEEGLAQFMDGRCGAYSVDDVCRALSNTYVPMDTLTTQFRQLNDLKAYMQAASIVGYIYRQYGRDATRDVWQHGVDVVPKITGESVPAFAEAWWRQLTERAKPVSKADAMAILKKGCG